jgi:alkylated DNA repair dioxygenase AlkB
MDQACLFTASPQLPIHGWAYQRDFISSEEQHRLLTAAGTVALRPALYRQFIAKRRIISYGGSYDFTQRQLNDSEPIPAFLHGLRARLAAWAGIPAESFAQATIAEYPAGTRLGWHRDVPDFEVIAGVSLLSACRMRFRPYPPKNLRRCDRLSLVLEPLSAYVIRGPARWRWQHSIPPTPGRRFSITFRTFRANAAV